MSQSTRTYSYERLVLAQAVINDLTHQLRRRLHASIDAGGYHFEHGSRETFIILLDFTAYSLQRNSKFD